MNPVVKNRFKWVCTTLCDDGFQTQSMGTTMSGGCRCKGANLLEASMMDRSSSYRSSPYPAMGDRGSCFTCDGTWTLKPSWSSVSAGDAILGCYELIICVRYVTMYSGELMHSLQLVVE